MRPPVEPGRGEPGILGLSSLDTRPLRVPVARGEDSSLLILGGSWGRWMSAPQPQPAGSKTARPRSRSLSSLPSGTQPPSPLLPSPGSRDGASRSSKRRGGLQVGSGVPGDRVVARGERAPSTVFSLPPVFAPAKLAGCAPRGKLRFCCLHRVIFQMHQITLGNCLARCKN